MSRKSSKVYLYHQHHRVMLHDESSEVFDKRYEQVYTRVIEIHRGVGNRVLFEFVNQNERPQDITSKTFVFRLLDAEGSKVLHTSELEIVNAERGQAVAVVPVSVMDGIIAQRASFSIELVSDTISEAVYVDDSNSARGTVVINDSVYPRFIESKQLTFPSSVPPDYESSIIVTTEKSNYTVVIGLEQFTGDITVRGSANGTSDWYDIDAFSFVDETGSHVFNVTGFHSYLRLYVLNNTAGEITGVTYR